MPTRNVHLTPRLNEFVEQCTSSGRYQTASEVVRAALRLLHEKDAEEQSWRQAAAAVANPVT